MSIRAARLWVRALIGSIPVLVVLGFANPAAAYPWMIRHGFAQCASCHTDPMGGETLTGFGRAMGDSVLATQWDGDDAPTSAAELFYGVDEPEWGRFGGSARWMSILSLPRDDQDAEFRTFPMQLDAYGQLRFGDFRMAGSIGASRVPDGSPHARPAQVTSADGESLNLISRNHWIGYDVADGWLVRAGRINLPFGVRIPEHVMWAREATRTDRESDQHHGVGVSYAKGRIRTELMGIAGNYQISPDEYRERGYSFFGEYMILPNVGVGLSSLVTHAGRDRLLQAEDYTRQAHGVAARLSPTQDFALLAELDALLTTETSAGYATLVQADYELLRGLHLMGTLEALDMGAIEGLPTAPGLGQPGFGTWFSVNWFFVTHFDFRLDVVIRQEAPVTFQSQAHFYF
jgi:hypothetical protein